MLDKWALWDWECYRVQHDPHNFICDHGSGWSCCLCLLEERLLSALFSNSLPSSSSLFCKTNTILFVQQCLRHCPRDLFHSISCMLHLPRERVLNEGPTLINPSFLHHFCIFTAKAYLSTMTAAQPTSIVKGTASKEIELSSSFSVFTAHSVHVFTFSCTGILLIKSLVRFTKNLKKSWKTWFEYKPSNTPYLLYPKKASLKKRAF